jgi:hypothetical protein
MMSMRRTFRRCVSLQIARISQDLFLLCLTQPLGSRPCFEFALLCAWNLCRSGGEMIGGAHWFSRFGRLHNFVCGVFRGIAAL